MGLSRWVVCWGSALLLIGCTGGLQDLGTVTLVDGQRVQAVQIQSHLIQTYLCTPVDDPWPAVCDAGPFYQVP